MSCGPTLAWTAWGRRLRTGIGRGLRTRVGLPRILGRPLAIERQPKDLPSFYVTHGGRVSHRATRRSTSPCGTCSARSATSPFTSCSVAGPAATRHLQHLRRLPLRQGGGRHRVSACRAVPARWVGEQCPKAPRRLLRGLPDRAQAGLEPADGYSGDQDLAVRRRGVGQQWSVHRPQAAGAVQPFDKVPVVGSDRIEIMVELHGRAWEAAPAIKICKALADYSPYWVEDAVRLDSGDAFARLRDADDDRPFAFGKLWPACMLTSVCSTRAP